MQEARELTPAMEERAWADARAMSKDLAQDLAKKEYDHLIALEKEGRLLEALEAKYEAEHFPRYLAHCRDRARRSD